MSQIQTDTAAVVNGSAIVTASAGNDWSDAAVNNWFCVPGVGAVIYDVAAVRPPGVNASGRWELTLSATYQGTTAATAAYAITKDFSPEWGFPILARGDVETHLHFNRAMRLIDQGFPAPAGPPVTIGAGVALATVTGGGSTSLDGTVTVGMTDRAIRDVVPAGDVPSRWVKLPGTNATDIPGGYLRPLDYNASTNPVNWVRIS